MTAGEVEIYTTRFCPYCLGAKDLLQKKGVRFREIAVDGAGDLRREMAVRSGGRSSVPQIFVGATHVGGCDDLYALERAGTLDGLLQENATEAGS